VRGGLARAVVACTEALRTWRRCVCGGATCTTVDAADRDEGDEGG